jgi:hypothetical protein
MVRGSKIFVFSLMLMSSASFVYGQETKAAVKSWDDFKIIAERNIFSRNRTKIVVLSETQRQVETVPEQRYHTLRGITKQADGYVSFIEDSRTSIVTRYRKGDPVAEGKIADITLDDISYKRGGKTLKIETGMNLEGQASVSYMQEASMTGGPMNNSGFAAMGQMQGGTGQQGPGGMGQQVQGGAMGDQFQGRGGQGPGINQSQATGQPEATTTISQPADQTQTAAQAVKAGQSSESGDEILQRLKEKRKKELQE